HPRAGPVRRDVRLAGRPFHAATPETPRPPGRTSDRRIWISDPETRAEQHLLQADGRTVPLPFHDHYHQSGLRRVAQLSGQQVDGGRTAEPRAALLPHGDHRRSVASRTAGLRRNRVKENPISRDEYIDKVL